MSNNGKDKTILITHTIGGRIAVDLVDLINTIHSDEDGWFDRITDLVEESYNMDKKLKEDS